MLSFDADILYRIPALLIALTIHEYAHAQAADSLGDPTAKNWGRLTLNPISHIDPLGLLMLVFAGFGWAKPVPINPSNFRNIRQGIKLVSFAGPGSNLFVAFLATFFMVIMSRLNILTDGVYTFLLFTQMYNVWFALFNLIPLPPLDGYKILSSYLSFRTLQTFQKIEPYSMYIMLGLVITGIIGIVLRPIAYLIINFMTKILTILF